LAHFASTRLLLPRLWPIKVPWTIALWRLQYTNGLTTIAPTLTVLFFAQTAKSLWSIFCGSGSSHNGCETIAISQLSQRDMPMN
jgi:hypothetical protein